VAAIVRHLPGHYNPFNLVVANARAADTASFDPAVSLVTATPRPVSSPRIVIEDVVRDDNPLRHDPEKLGALLLRLHDEFRRARTSNGAVHALR
jgi:hypothetical protein